MDGSITFSRGRRNPDHGRLLDYVQRSFAARGEPQQSINRITSNLRDLRRDRENSDYKPDEIIDVDDAKSCLCRAEAIMDELGLLR